MGSSTRTRHGADNAYRSRGVASVGFPPEPNTMVVWPSGGTAHPPNHSPGPSESGSEESGDHGPASWRQSLTALARGAWISQLFLVAALAISTLGSAVGIPVLVI